MDVDLRSEESGRHGAALDMPARAAPAPGAFPPDITVGLVPRLPESEIPDIFLLVFVAPDPDSGLEFIQHDVGELAVGRKRPDPEIDRAIVRAVGVASLHESRYHRNHPGDVVGGGGLRKMIGPLDAQGIEIFEEGLFERFGELRQRHPGCPAPSDRFVIDIGEVHDADDAEPPVFQVSLEQVLEDVGPEVSDVGKIINRRPASVEADDSGFQRNEFLDLAGEGIKEANWHRAAS